MGPRDRVMTDDARPDGASASGQRARPAPLAGRGRPQHAQLHGSRVRTRPRITGKRWSAGPRSEATRASPRAALPEARRLLGPSGRPGRWSFLDGVDMDLAAVEVRDRVDRFHLTSDWTEDHLQHFVDEVLGRRLERLEGRGPGRRERAPGCPGPGGPPPLASSGHEPRRPQLPRRAWCLRRPEAAHTPSQAAPASDGRRSNGLSIRQRPAAGPRSRRRSPARSARPRPPGARRRRRGGGRGPGGLAGAPRRGPG